jgi:hypothetical protein
MIADGMRSCCGLNRAIRLKSLEGFVGLQQECCICISSQFDDIWRQHSCSAAVIVAPGIRHNMDGANSTDRIVIPMMNCARCIVAFCSVLRTIPQKESVFSMRPFEGGAVQLIFLTFRLICVAQIRQLTFNRTQVGTHVFTECSQTATFID